MAAVSNKNIIKLKRDTRTTPIKSCLKTGTHNDSFLLSFILTLLKVPTAPLTDA